MCNCLRLALVAWLFCTMTPVEAKAQARPRWSTSKIAGTPDPKPPYKVELAFPKIKLLRPILLDHMPGSDWLVVGEVAGKVLTFRNDPGADKTEIAIDLATARPGVSALYGLAFHPKFEINRHVFLCYVTKNDISDGTRVSRFKATNVDPLRIDPASEEILLTYPSGGHNGGCLAFGPEGYLYISTGDATAPTPPDGLKTGQDISDLLSSILRIDVDGRDPGKAYRIPSDNPFVNVAKARPEVWAFGLRNPWRMSFDRKRGELWVGDVGWELWEMIHLVKRGQNCGWSVVEASQPVLVDLPKGPTPIVPPVIAHPHSEAASITGGYVYHGKRLSKLEDVYIYGDYQSGMLWGLRHDGEKVTWKGLLADTGLRLVAFGEDREGEIYLVEHDRSNSIYRLVPNPNPSAQNTFPRKLSETGLFSSTRLLTPNPGVLPYQIIAKQWADGTFADRVMAIPDNGKIEVTKEGRWNLPEGSVLAKTVSSGQDQVDPKFHKRLETQILHREDGAWRAYSYHWNSNQSDAILVEAEGANLTFETRANGMPNSSQTQNYHIAGRAECVLCHNPWVGEASMFGRQSASPLALNSSQLSSDHFPENMYKSGYLDKPIGPTTTMVDPSDITARLDGRARAYLAVNCAHCHQANAGGTAAIDLSLSKSLIEMRAIDVLPAQGRFAIDDARIIAPGEPERSILYYRMSKTGSGRMPRSGSDHVDIRGTHLIGDWITAMPKPNGTKGISEADAKLIGVVFDSDSTLITRSEAIGSVLSSPRLSLALIRAMQTTGMPIALRIDIARRAKTAAPEVNDLYERFLPENERAKQLGDRFDEAALLSKKGDPDRGRTRFRAEGGLNCKTCHKAEGVGGDIGPALDGIGSKYVLKELLDHIVQPSRVVEPKYHTHVVVTKSGQVHSGLLIEENAKELVLGNALGERILVPLKGIEERRRLPTSIMPDGQLRGLTDLQAADLLAYLASLKKS